MKSIPSHIFRANDIRGIADRDLTDKVTATIAISYAIFLKEKKINSVGIGRDIRLSSPRIHSVFVEWIRKAGVKVYDFGQTPSPAAYFAVFTKKEIDALAIITASHNPTEYNGIKLNYLQKSLSQEEILELYTLSRKVNLNDYANNKLAKYEEMVILPDYIDYLSHQFSFKKNFNIVVDPANATGCLISPLLFKKLKIDAKIINKKIDGSFPKHEPDPTVSENLKRLGKKVIKREADCGIGYDGDSDRIGVVDNLGRFIPCDILTALFAKNILKEHKGASIVIEVKSSQVLIDTIEKAGGVVQMTKVGHGFMKQKIAETKALLAGELSGHMFFCDRYFGFDDAFYCTLRLLEILDNTDKPLSDLIDEFPQYYNTPEIHLKCKSDQEKFRTFRKLEKDLKKFKNVTLTDGVRIQFKHGWGLVRPSNTQPVIVTRYEADSPKRLEDIQHEITSIIDQHFSGEKQSM